MATRSTAPPLARWLLTLVLVAGSFVAGLAFRPSGGGATAANVLPAAQPVAAPPRPSPAARRELAEEERATVELFRAASPSVVFITSIALQRDLFSMNVFEIPRGVGSGFLFDDRGDVVTNYHVIEGANAAQVTLADHSTWDARPVGVAPEKDLAVLRIEAPRERLRPLPIGSSAGLQVGQAVFAIGNPFGLDQTLTTGVVSALGREIQSLTGTPIRDAVQTDAAINPGNSGGPLIDSGGRVIGVNTAIYSPSGAYAGIGFAIPIDTVAWVAPQLIQRGHLVRPSLGVRTAPDPLVRDMGLEGALVVEVTPGSGAERAGLQPTRRNRLGGVVLGDLIIAVDGQPVRTNDDLLLLLETHKPGDRLRVTLEREGRKREATVELGRAL